MGIFVNFYVIQDFFLFVDKPLGRKLTLRCVGQVAAAAPFSAEI